MTMEASATPIADAVRLYLDNNGWKYSVREENGTLMFSAAVSLSNGEFHTSFDADDDKERFAVYVYSTVFIPKSRRLAVAEYLTRVNFTLYLGNIQMDLDDGEVRSVTSVTVEGSHLSQAMIKHLDNSAHFRLDDAYPGLMAVAFGNASPLDAFETNQQQDESEISDRCETTEEAVI